MNRVARLSHISRPIWQPLPDWVGNLAQSGIWFLVSRPGFWFLVSRPIQISHPIWQPCLWSICTWHLTSIHHPYNIHSSQINSGMCWKKSILFGFCTCEDWGPQRGLRTSVRTALRTSVRTEDLSEDCVEDLSEDCVEDLSEDYVEVL